MKNIIIALFIAAAPASLCAEQWKILGTRPMGMGGAFVAVAQGPIAQYWNPGGLVKSSANVSGMELPVGVMAEFTGDIMKNASAIGDMAQKFSAIQSAQDNGTSINADQIAAFAKTLSLISDMNEPGKGVLAEVAGGANFKFSKVALSVNNFTSVGLNPFIDTANIGLDTNGSNLSGVNFTGANQTNTSFDSAETTLDSAINTIGYSNLETLICGAANCLNTEQGITNQTTFIYALINKAAADGLSEAQINEAANTLSQYAADVAPMITAAASGNSYYNNTSNLNVVGASFVEIAAGYAWNVDKWLHGLSVGGNIKMINGRTTNTTFRFLSESDTADSITLEDMKSSWQPAVDLGLMWDVNRTYPKLPLHPKVGFVMRNINSPSFDVENASDYDLDRQARIGFALNPAKFWTLALDLDVTKNKTPVDGFDSRQLCMGTEINIFNRKAFNIPLRAGLMKNLAEKDSKMAYTLGTGLNLLYMHFDVSGVVSTEKTTMDDTDIPTKLGVAASFGLLF
ncbi:MAG: conjugal transfer protein TraF [Elusimicrobiales bacterium]|nr:conjugal transfer protein TraF [Elusimicrobiales bacterium]